MATQGVYRLVERSAIVGLAFCHQIKVGVVNRRRNRIEKVFVGLADGNRQRAPLRGDLDTLANRSIERIEPILHGTLRDRDFVTLAGIERPHALDPGLQMLGLHRDLIDDLRPLVVVLDRDQARGRSDQAIGVLGEAERLDGCRHAARDDIAQRRADID